MDSTLNQSQNKFLQVVKIFFATTSAAALSVYAYLGAFTRPIGDDYCFSAWLTGTDPLTAGLYKYTTTSNRFSNQFVVFASDLFGPPGAGVLSVTMMILWLVGLTWLYYEIARALRLRWELLTGFLLAELVALVSYYSAANLFQSVYWRPGMMTYFMPIVIYSFIFAGILRGSRISANRPSTTPLRGSAQDGVLLLTITILFFGAFFTGGLSETMGALHISILGLALVVNLIWNKGQTRRAALVFLTATIAGALLALIGMFLAPANAFRLEASNTPTLPEAILRALMFGLQFLREAARLLRLPSAFALGSGALIGYTYIKSGGMDAPSARKMWLGLILVPILAYLLVVASFAPSAYGQSYPADRVRFPAQVLLVAALLLEGGLLGLLAARWPLPHWTTALTVVLLALFAFYPLWMTRHNLALILDYQTRAAQWDARDARIRELADAGEKNVVVWQLPGIAQVKDLDTRPSHWINYCAAIYYGVDTLSAPQGQIPSP